jgi:hypothetical protein
VVIYNHKEQNKSRNGRRNNMTKYYINGKKATKEEAEKQEKINNDVMNIEDLEEWLKNASKCEFIISIEA